MHDLERFLTAQVGDYDRALAELRDGRKRSHWIWYVLPQLKGLGRSSTSERFGGSAASVRGGHAVSPPGTDRPTDPGHARRSQVPVVPHPVRGGRTRRASVPHRTRGLLRRARRAHPGPPRSWVTYHMRGGLGCTGTTPRRRTRLGSRTSLLPAELRADSEFKRLTHRRRCSLRPWSNEHGAHPGTAVCSAGEPAPGTLTDAHRGAASASSKAAPARGTSRCRKASATSPPPSTWTMTP